MSVYFWIIYLSFKLAELSLAELSVRRFGQPNIFFRFLHGTDHLLSFNLNPVEIFQCNQKSMLAHQLQTV